jgi:hypothetical protein
MEEGRRSGSAAMFPHLCRQNIAVQLIDPLSVLLSWPRAIHDQCGIAASKLFGDMAVKTDRHIDLQRMWNF